MDETRMDLLESRSTLLLGRHYWPAVLRMSGALAVVTVLRGGDLCVDADNERKRISETNRRAIRVHMIEFCRFMGKGCAEVRRPVRTEENANNGLLNFSCAWRPH